MLINCLTKIQHCKFVFESIKEVNTSVREVNETLSDTIKSQTAASEVIHNNVNLVKELTDINRDGISNLVEDGKRMDSITSKMEDLMSQYKMH